MDPLKEVRTTSCVRSYRQKQEDKLLEKKVHVVPQTFPSPRKSLASPCWSILGVSTIKDARVRAFKCVARHPFSTLTPPSVPCWAVPYL